VWVLLGTLSKKGEELEKRDVMESLMDGKVTDKLKIVQFIKDKKKPVNFEYLEDLLDDISANDLKSGKKTRFIYSGNNEFPFGVREQWTDSCNLLAVKEGVAIGYDRNDKTVEAFRNAGFDIICAADLLEAFESGSLSPETMENTLILLPSAELSRARGGSHCMSMPLFREKV
jgi:arginine deiminase